MVWRLMASLKKTLRDTSIRHKLLLSYIVLISFPLVFLVTISWRKISHGLRENMYGIVLNAIEQSASFLEYKLEYITNIADLIMLDSNLQQILTRDYGTYHKDYMQQSVDAHSLYDYFKSFEDNNDIFMVRLYVRDGLTYSNVPPYFLNMKTAAENAWFQEVLTPGRKYEWFPSSYFSPGANPNKEQVVALLRRVIDQNNYRNTVGVLRVDIRENTLTDIIKKANITDLGLTYLQNSRGELITSFGNPALIQLARQNRFLDRDSTEKEWKVVRIDHQQFLTVYQTIDRTDWKLVTLIPYSAILNVGREIRNFMWIIMSVAVIIAYFTAFYLSHLGVSQISALGAMMNKVRDGDLKVELPVKSNDEIGQLTKNFNYMVKQMAVMIEEKFIMGKKMKNLELKALQAQINPHFLYNSLDMINWTAVINGIPEIETMVQALAKFYKISLSKGREFIFIREEIEHVLAYITIQNLRFDNQIKLHLQIDEDIYDYKIIKIVLQPIVENAILHGILKKKKKKGTITITGRLDHDQIILTVTDDGIGMDEVKLKNLLAAGNNSRGYGLKNINSRLKLNYGPQYGLAFNSKPGKGTTVTVTLPAML